MNNKLMIGGALLVAGILVGGSYLITTSSVVSSELSQDKTQYAPDFTLTTLDGGTLTLSDYRNQKAVVLDFWATWCPNCRRSMPKTQELYEKYGDHIEVIGVNLHEDRSLVQQFVTDSGLTFPIVLDPKSDAVTKYAIRYTNYHVLINKEGFVVQAVPGDLTEAHILSLLDR